MQGGTYMHNRPPADSFLPLIGEAFCLTANDQELSVTLDSVTERPLAKIPDSTARTPFTLVFKTRSPFEDGSHDIHHQSFGVMDNVYINRILPQGDADYAWYQINFN